MKPLLSGTDVWPYKVIIDTLAHCLDLPLQAISVVSPQTLDNYLNKHPDFITAASNYVEIRPHLFGPDRSWQPDMAKLFPLLKSNKPLAELLFPRFGGIFHITTPTQESPLFRLLRDHRPWRWWETLWLNNYALCKCRRPEDDRRDIIQYPAPLGGAFTVAAPAILPGSEFALVGGPVRAYTATYQDDGHAYSEPIDAFLDGFSSILSAANFSFAYTDERLTSAWHARWPISLEDLDRRFAIALKALCALAQTQIPQHTLVTRELLASFSEFACFALLKEGADTAFLEDCAYLIRPSSKYSALKIPPQLAEKVDVYIAIRRHSGDRTGATYSLSNSFDAFGKPPYFTGRLGKGQQTLEHSPSTFLDVDRALSAFLGGVGVRHHNTIMENYVAIRHWLSDQFGMMTLSDLSTEGVRNSPISEVQGNDLYRLCRRICSMVLGDVVTLFRYDHVEEVLNTLGVYHSGQEATMWRSSAPDHMRKAAHNEDTRSSSICYRAVDTYDQRYCHWFDPASGVSYPPGEHLLLPAEGLKSGRCAIATPVLVLGRCWGVLEILGFRPFQFDGMSRRVSAELGNILSGFFYTQSLLTGVRDIISVILDDRKESSAKYLSICHTLSRVFLAESVSLWLRDDSEIDRLNCVGFINRVDLYDYEDYERQMPFMSLQIGESSPLAKTDPILHRLFEESELFTSNYFGKEPFNEQWLASATGRLLNEKGYRAGCAFLIRAKGGKRPARGAVLLYSKSPQHWGSNWRNVIAFISRTLELSFVAMDVREDWERRYRRIVAHEMMHQVRTLDVQARKLVAYVAKTKASQSALTEQEENEIRKLSIWQFDISKAAKDLIDNVMILRANNLLDAKEENIDPMIKKVQMRIDKEPLELCDIIAEFDSTFRAVQREFRDKGAELVLKSNSMRHRHPVVMHGGSIRDIFQNLATNAIKYCKKNTSILAELSEDEAFLHFRIENIAPALNAAEEDKLFQKGFRSEWARRTSKEGEGLGLFIVKGICDIYDLTVGYSSRPAPREGVNFVWHTFKVSFPMKRVRRDQQ